MPIDPSIAMSAAPTPNMGPNMGVAIQNAQQLYGLQQMQQQAQAQNALKSIMSQPGMVDETGNPTPNALKQISAVSPEMGMKLRQNMLVQQQAKLQQDVTKTSLFGKKMDLMGDGADAATIAYEAGLQRGLTPQQATSAAQDVYTEKLQSLSDSGLFSTEEVGRMPKQFDPVKVKAFSGNLEDWRKQQALRVVQDKKARSEGRLDAAQTERERHDRAMEGKTSSSPASAAEHDVEAIANANITTKEKELGRTMTDAEKAAERQNARSGSGKLAASPAAIKERDIETLARAQFRQTHDGKEPGPDDAADLAKLKQAERSRSTAMSGRNAQMVGRSLTSAADAVTDLRNIVELPISIDTGIFGGRKQGPGLMAATKEILANRVTGEDAQAYNTAMAGLERSLGGLATGGLAVSDNVMNQFGKLQIEKGDTNLIKLRKLATMRQNVDNGLDGLLTNPQLGDAQKAMVEKLQKEVQTAVPWTVHDVNQVEFGKDIKATVGQFAKKVGVSKPDDKTADVNAPAAAVAYLKAHPDAAPHFDEKYGSGAAAKVLVK